MIERTTRKINNGLTESKVYLFHVFVREKNDQNEHVRPNNIMFYRIRFGVSRLLCVLIISFSVISPLSPTPRGPSSLAPVISSILLCLFI